MLTVQYMLSVVFKLVKFSKAARFELVPNTYPTLHSTAMWSGPSSSDLECLIIIQKILGSNSG